MEGRDFPRSGRGCKRRLAQEQRRPRSGASTWEFQAEVRHIYGLDCATWHIILYDTKRGAAGMSLRTFHRFLQANLFYPVGLSTFLCATLLVGRVVFSG